MCYPFPKVGKVVQIWEKIYGKIFWKRPFIRKGGTLVEKSKILVEFFTSNCSPK